LKCNNSFVPLSSGTFPKEKTKENDQKGRKKRKKESPFFRAKEQLCQGFCQ